MEIEHMSLGVYHLLDGFSRKHACFIYSSLVAPVLSGVYRVCCKILLTCWLDHFAHRVDVSRGLRRKRTLGPSS